MRLGAWLRSGEGIGWLAAGTIPNSLYRVPFSYLFLACALCFCCFFLSFLSSFVLFFRKNLNASRPSGHPSIREENVKTFMFCFVFTLSLELCRCSSDIFLSSKPRTVPDWQSRILLGMVQKVEARSVNVKNTHTHTLRNKYH